MRILLSIIAMLCTIPFNSIRAQQCGTDQFMEQYFQEHPEERARFEAEADQISRLATLQGGNAKSGNVLIVPVVVHVIHDEGVGNISKEQIENGIANLNRDFRKKNGDTTQHRSPFKNLAADIEIDFKLARLDPQGNCTEGIVRVNSPLTYDARNNVKALSYWPSNKYMNVWIVNSIQNFSGQGVILGFAQFPGLGSWNTYGIVVRQDQWGSIGTSNSDGRTITHEIGHCFNLYHTFQSGCGSSCNTSGDRVCDTPPTMQATYGCSKVQNTCSNDASTGSAFTTNVVDMIENYMSYDGCQNMFTIGQKDRMRASINFHANLTNLVSASNLVATGTNDGYVAGLCTPVADFRYDNDRICSGRTVTYTDDSYNGKASTRTWTFAGGTPSTSSDSIVTVTYNTPGTYSATLQVGNTNGNDSYTRNSVVDVVDGQADFSGAFFSESFEDENHFDQYYEVNNISGGFEWRLTNMAAYTGDHSIYLKNHSQFASGIKDEFITPSYDMSVISQPILKYQVAYARRSAASADFLRIYTTEDCGLTWILRKASPGVQMETAPARTNEFVPASKDEWTEVTVFLPQALYNSTNVRFKFEFTTGVGNNIYIDDINIQSLTGIDEKAQLENAVNLFPNPTNDVVNIAFDMEGSRTIDEVAVIDYTGRKIDVIGNRLQMVDGQNTLQYDVSALSQGIYFVSITSEGQQIVKKLVVR